MRISIFDTPKDIAVQTITLSHNHKEPDNVLMFRCILCASAVCQIQGVVTEIFPGHLHDITVPVITRCSKCSQLYVFQTKDSERPYTRVTLVTNDPFHCVICRKQLVRGSVVTPFEKTCGCGRQYHFADMV